MSDFERQAPRRRFERQTGAGGSFLEVRCRRFEEKDASGATLTARAMELVVTGELLDGREAARVGLVSRAVPDDELLDGARTLLGLLADGPTRAFVESKRLVGDLRARRGLDTALLAAEAAAQGAASRTQDYIEGFTAFQAKRPPTFTGR